MCPSWRRSLLGVRIYTDEDVNPAIAAGLRRRGIDAWAASEVRNFSLSDEDQLLYASQYHAVLFTHDAHLVGIASEWAKLGKEHWGVVYVHRERTSIGECILRLKDLAEILTPKEMKNRVEFL